MQGVGLVHLPMLGSPEVFFGLGVGPTLLLGFCPPDEPHAGLGSSGGEVVCFLLSSETKFIAGC